MLLSSGTLIWLLLFGQSSSSGPDGAWAAWPARTLVGATTKNFPEFLTPCADKEHDGRVPSLVDNPGKTTSELQVTVYMVCNIYPLSAPLFFNSLLTNKGNKFVSSCLLAASKDRVFSPLKHIHVWESRIPGFVLFSAFPSWQIIYNSAVSLSFISREPHQSRLSTSRRASWSTWTSTSASQSCWRASSRSPSRHPRRARVNLANCFFCPFGRGQPPTSTSSAIPMVQPGSPARSTGPGQSDWTSSFNFAGFHQ